MSLRIKVQDGTGADIHLCSRCANAMRRVVGGRQTQSCETTQPPTCITGKVTECNRFNSHSDELISMTLKPQAWIIVDDGDNLTWQTPGRKTIVFGDNYRSHTDRVPAPKKRKRAHVVKNPKRNFFK